jgi:HAD superfamily hydrolase (TIGR01549 family)
MHESITAYIFDMDGTLVDTSSCVPQAFIECIMAVGGRRYTPEEVVASYDLGPPNVILSHLLGRSCTTGDLDTYHRHLQSQAMDLRPYPGVATLIERLKHDHPLAVFSGASHEACELLLRSADLARFFDAIVGGDEAPRPKPFADGLLLACSRLGVHPSKVAYIGDSKLDVQTARAASCHAYAAGWGHLYDSNATRPDRLLMLPSDLLVSV